MSFLAHFRKPQVAAALFSGLLLPGLFTGCVKAEHPCDPGATEDVQRSSSLTGRVVDPAGNGMVGIPVLLVERNETTLSGENGEYTFRDLIPTEAGYTVVALPQTPAMGGRVTTESLGCQSELAEIELVVVTPPNSPEVEITAATSPERMLVAFAAVEEIKKIPDGNSMGAPTNADSERIEFSRDCSNPDEVMAGDIAYRAEIREPFGQWEKALLTIDPRLEFDDDAALAHAVNKGWVVSKLNDRCTETLCGHFSYAFPDLQDPDNAPRCVEVVGIQDANGQVRRLSHFGQMQVRIRADLRTQTQALGQQVPPMVPSAATANSAVLSLVPTSVMPVSMASSLASSVETEKTMDVTAIVPVGGEGRFALITGTDMMIIDGLGAKEEAYDQAPDAAMALDTVATEDASGAVTETSGEALAVLPAGKWIRVWKRITDENGVRSMVRKIFVGGERGESAAADAIDNNRYQPIFDFDVAQSSSAFRKFSWLTQPSGDPTAYNPTDGYFLLFKDGFVLAESAAQGEDLAMAALSESMADDGTVDSEWSAPAEGVEPEPVDPSNPNALPAPPLGFGGFCNELSTGGIHVEDLDGETATRTDVCFNVSEALGSEVNFVDVAVFAESNATGPREEAASFHLLADKKGDRIFAVRTSAFLGQSGSLLSAVKEVRVGVDPVAMHRSAFIECDANNALLFREEVTLVANAGSEDVSVLGLVDTENGTKTIEEVGVVAVGGVPVGFLTDLSGPTCKDPFVWVRADDGTLYPLDMRSGGTPQCGDKACSVSTRSRAPTGAVTHVAGQKARVLVGGHGMLGELGFLRPVALTEGVDLTGGLIDRE